jgi:hypothetical protein
MTLDRSRLALQSYVRQVGGAPTVKEQIEITKRRSKLLSRITDHQRRAHRHLRIAWKEDNDYGYEPTELFIVGDDGEIELVRPVPPCIADPFHHGTTGPRPEAYRITMPSTISPNIQDRTIAEAARLELQLRAGQCNDSLQGVRLALGKKAFLFRTKIRPKGAKTGKTRAWDAIHTTDQTLRLQAQTYRSAREALLSLPGSVELLNRYQVLQKEHLKTSTTMLDPTQSGWKHGSLPWFWYLDVASDSLSSDHMKECK